METCVGGGGWGRLALYAGPDSWHGDDGDVDISVVLITHHHVEQG